MEAAAADLEIRMEPAAEAVKINERRMKEAARADFKDTTAKATALLLFLVGVCTDRCKYFNIIRYVHGYS